MRRVVLGYVGSEADARPVLLATLEVARLFRATAEAVQARSRVSSASRAVRKAGVPVRVFESARASGLIAEAARQEVACMVISAPRRPFADTSEHGATFVELATSTRKPLVVLPPDARIGPIHRLLAPLDGSPDASQALWRALKRTHAADVEVAVLHVCAQDDAPAFSDHPLYETEAWGSEFLARHCPIGRLELRLGSAAEIVSEVAAATGADLIVLGWGQLLARGQGRVVRRVLEAARIPVLLLSARRTPSLARRAPTTTALSGA